MRFRVSILAGAGSVLMLLAGCAASSKKPEMTAQPAHDELPEIRRTMRGIPANVGVEHVDRVPREPLVVLPDISKPTPEEKAKLGPEAEPKKDRTAFAFYRKERGAAQGVDPFEDHPRGAVGSPDRTRFGITSSRLPYASDEFSDAGARTRISDIPERKSAQSTIVENRFGVTLYPYYPSTGMIDWRRGAALDPIIPYRD